MCIIENIGKPVRAFKTSLENLLDLCLVSLSQSRSPAIKGHNWPVVYMSAGGCRENRRNFQRKPPREWFSLCPLTQHFLTSAGPRKRRKPRWGREMWCSSNSCLPQFAFFPWRSLTLTVGSSSLTPQLISVDTVRPTWGHQDPCFKTWRFHHPSICTWSAGLPQSEPPHSLAWTSHLQDSLCEQLAYLRCIWLSQWLSRSRESSLSQSEYSFPQFLRGPWSNI